MEAASNSCVGCHFWQLRSKTTKKINVRSRERSRRLVEGPQQQSQFDPHAGCHHGAGEPQLRRGFWGSTFRAVGAPAWNDTGRRRRRRVLRAERLSGDGQPAAQRDAVAIRVSPFAAHLPRPVGSAAGLYDRDRRCLQRTPLRRIHARPADLALFGEERNDGVGRRGFLAGCVCAQPRGAAGQRVALDLALGAAALPLARVDVVVRRACREESQGRASREPRAATE